MYFSRKIALAMSVAVACLAQQTMNYASIGGRVTDPSGRVIEGAVVTARATDTRLSQTAVTATDGRFRFPYLKTGPYEISVEHQGFTPVGRQLTLTVGSAYELQLTLTVQSESTKIDVSAEAPVIETARSQIAATVSTTEIRNLPLNGRNFLDIALLVPGVSATNIPSTQLFPETSAVQGQGISIGSQRNFSNSFIVDGLSANDDAAGLSGMPYGVDALSEFQVVTSGGQAEFGRALGGYVNVVTRSGTNTLHGDAYGFFRHKSMNAKNPLSGTKLPYTQTQYGASLGGPLVKERTFYFGNFEQRRLNQSGLVTISPANVAAINARLAATGYQGPRVTTGLFSSPVDTTNGLAKVDHQLSSNDLLTVRYSSYSVASENSRGAGALNAPSSAAGLENTDHSIAVSNILSLSSRVVNETRGQFLRSDLAAEPNDGVGPTVSIAGVATFGRLAGSPTARRNKLYELVNNVSIHAGAHAVRFGGSYLQNNTTIMYPRQIRGSYAFSSLANFLSGTYNNLGFTQTFGVSEVRLSNPNAGFYVQDEWKLHPNFTVNLGVRYDLQFLEEVNTDTDNISPRIGVAWSPFRSRRTVVRGSYGLFYDRVPLRALANALMSSNNTVQVTDTSQISVSLSPTQAGAPVFPNIMSTRPAGVLANFTTMDRNMRNAHSQQASVEIEQELTPGTTLSVGYQHLRGLHLIASANQNPPSCVASGTNNGCRPNPAYANNSQYGPRGDSQYDGLHVSFAGRPNRWGSYRVSYTWSKSMNNVGEFFFSSPIDNFNIWQDWGRSDDDQRHRLSINGNVERYGFRLSGTLQYYSALPFNITTGQTTIQGTSARPIVNGSFIPRNAGEGFDRLSLNLRLSRQISITERVRVEALAEMFNLTNRVNGVALNGTFGAGAYPSNPSPAFGRTTAVGEPRSAQLGLRLSF